MKKNASNVPGSGVVSTPAPVVQSDTVVASVAKPGKTGKAPRPQLCPFEVDDRISIKARIDIAGKAGRLLLEQCRIEDKQVLAFAHSLRNVDAANDD